MAYLQHVLPGMSLVSEGGRMGSWRTPGCTCKALTRGESQLQRAPSWVILPQSSVGLKNGIS